MKINKEELQKILEKKAVKKNGGMCESYEYCKFCKESQTINRKSITPCADALLTLKDINTMLKSYIKNKAKIATIAERINVWEKALDEGVNIFMKVPESTLGMPRAKNKINSPIEDIVLNEEMNEKQVKEMIKIEKNKKTALEYEVRKLDIAFSILNEKDMFLIECKYFENMDWVDIENSYNNTFKKVLTVKGLKNKMTNIKLKILKIIKTGQNWD